MSHLTPEQTAQIMWGSDEIDIHDKVLAMTLVRSARWHVEAYSSERGEWRTTYEGPSIRDAIHSVQDHDDTRVSYLYGHWKEIDCG